MPTKMAILPSSQNFFKGPMVGWKPSSSLMGMIWSSGTANVGRKSL